MALVSLYDPYAIWDGSEIFTSQTVHILLDCMKDTYDINKQIAFNLLVACPASIHPFKDIHFTLNWTTVATQCAISPKAINVSTAACMFKILIRKSPHKICLPANPENCTACEEECAQSDGGNKGNDEVASLTTQAYQLDLGDKERETSIPCMQAFRLLSQFVELLKSQIEVARKSLLEAAFEAPIHGVLYCVREVICDLQL
ncbi:Hypothetical predicted protein, partial [Paramuricea clavata]